MSLTVKAYAKLNLWLDITCRRPDGMHDIRTVMRRIDLCDDVTVDTNGSGEVLVTCDVQNIPTDERNIAYRAAKLFFSAAQKNVGAEIHIVKRIPVEAGLGGSSADGAAVLTALNTLCGQPFSIDKLCSLGAMLGADVPFCITGGTALCTGIGDVIRPIECADFAAVIIKPDFSCSTAEAYRKYDRSPIPQKDGIEEYCRNAARSCSQLAENMYNIFGEIYQDVRIEQLKADLMALGALGASLSGSGSAVFGIFRDITSAESAAQKLTGNIFTVNAI